MRVTFVLSVGCLVAASAATRADYIGLSVERHTTLSVAGISRDVYRVYANFDDPQDRFIEVFGSPTLGATTIQCRNFDDSGFGTGFYRTGGVIKAPTQELIDVNPNAQWSSFVTVGVSIADQAPEGDQVTTFPGFLPITGTNYTFSNNAWYVIPDIDHDSDPNTPNIPPSQTLAGFAGDGDLQLRVLLVQLTVNAGEHVRGTMNLITFQPFPSNDNTNWLAQTFNSVPSPGGLAVGAIIAAASRTRRRVR